MPLVRSSGKVLSPRVDGTGYENNTADVNRREIILVALLSIAAALVSGASFGDATSNHTTYLPKAIQGVQPGFLAGDWWLNDTQQYHVVFFRLVQALYWTGAPKIVMAAINTALITGTLGAVYGIIWGLTTARARFPAWCFVVAVFFVGLDATTVGQTYFFSPGLQPSTIATFLFVVAMLLFLHEWHALSGLALGLAGAVHFNYDIVGIAAFGLAQLGLGRERLLQRLIAQHWAMLVVLLANLPLVFAMQGGATPQESGLAADIFFHVAEPEHYRPATYLASFLPFVAWHILALGDLRSLSPSPVRARLLMLYLAMLAIIAVALALTTITFVPLVARAFLFRLSPFALLIACVVVAISAAQLLADSAPPRAQFAIRHVAYTLVRVVGVAIIAVFTYRNSSAGRLQATLVAASLFGAALLQTWPPPQRGWLGGLQNLLAKRQAALAAGLVLLMAIVSVDSRRFNLIVDNDRDHANALYRWAAATKDGSLFLVPPNLIGFRLLAGRAIIVDDKAVPMGTRAIIEWYRRMEDVSGRPGLRSIEEASKGYAQMDEARLHLLEKKYRVDYVVLRNTPEARRLTGEVVFSDPWFFVVKRAAEAGDDS